MKFMKVITVLLLSTLYLNKWIYKINKLQKGHHKSFCMPKFQKLMIFKVMLKITLGWALI